MSTRSLLLAAALLVPLITIGLLRRPSVATDQRWQRMEAWADQAERDWAARDFSRPPTWGAQNVGSAFEDYREASDRAEALRDVDEPLLLKWHAAPEELSEEALEGFSRRWRDALACMSRGAHQRDARPPVDWDAGFSHRTARLVLLRDLVTAATIEVRLRLERDEIEAAVELALDAATFGADMLQSPTLIDQMIACALVGISAGETWRDEDLARLDARTASLLANGLAVIDERCPLNYDCRGEALMLANTLLDTELNDNVLGELWASMRGQRGTLAMRGMAADAVLLQVALAERLEPDPHASWPEREALLIELMRDEDAVDNEVLQLLMPNWSSAERGLRSTAAIVRLLRAALAAHRGLEVPELIDPLGEGPLQVESTEAGELRIRSAGWPDQERLERVVVRRRAYSLGPIGRR